MARRRTHRRRSHSRRRISGVGGKGVIMKIAGVGAGIFAGRMLTTKLAATMNPKISGAIAILAGVFIPKYLKSELGQGIGDGLIASGVLAELQSFNVLAGIGAMPPGAYADISTTNNYNSNKARAVGADGRPIMKSTVGWMNGVPGEDPSTMDDLRKIGALIEE